MTGQTGPGNRSDRPQSEQRENAAADLPHSKFLLLLLLLLLQLEEMAV